MTAAPPTTPDCKTGATGAAGIRCSAWLGVRVEPAPKVYRAAGRRWFSKRAACRAAAREKINSRCECEPPEPGYTHGCGYPGMTCWYHKDPERYEKLVSKLAAVYARVTPNDPSSPMTAPLKPIESSDGLAGQSLGAARGSAWTCRLCGRDRFSRPGQPHRCSGGYRKNFKRAARLRGWDNCWIPTPNDQAQRPGGENA